MELQRIDYGDGGDRMILLVVDTQNLIMRNDLYEFQTFVYRIKTLIDTARKNDIEVIYVRHDDGVEQELTKGTFGYEIYEEFQPMPNERIFDKNANSAFRNTGLLDYLREKGEDTIVIVGLQTDYCIDATVKCGFEHGFKMIVPENTNSTMDNEYMSAESSYQYYNAFMWNGRYAECISFEKALALMNREKGRQPITLVRAGVDNAKEIHAMQVESFKGLLEKYQDYDTNPGNESVEKVEARLQQDFTYYYFICVGQQKAGAVRVVDKKEAGTNKRISPIFILPEFQGKGIAQKAIQLCEKMHGGGTWELDTILQEPGNCHLYEKMGYRQTGKTEVINERLTLVFYEKR